MCISTSGGTIGPLAGDRALVVWVAGAVILKSLTWIRHVKHTLQDYKQTIYKVGPLQHLREYTGFLYNRISGSTLDLSEPEPPINVLKPHPRPRAKAQENYTTRMRKDLHIPTAYLPAWDYEPPH